MDKTKLGFILLGIAFIIIGVGRYKNNNVKPVDFNNMNIENLEKGVIVEGDIYSCFGAYEETYKTNYGIRVSGGERYYYAIPIGENKIMGFAVSKGKNSDCLDKITETTFKNQEGVASEENSSLHFKGLVCKMTSEDEKFLREYLSYFGIEEREMAEYIVPYYISMVNYSDYMEFIIAGLLFVVIGCVFFVVMHSINKSDNNDINHLSTDIDKK